MFMELCLNELKYITSTEIHILTEICYISGNTLTDHMTLR